MSDLLFDPKNELIAPGHSACAGCGPMISLHLMLRATGKDVVICNATGCMEVVSTKYPDTAWRVPWIHVTFENAASVASGVAEALKHKGDTKTKVVALAGDGGAVDIGFRALSGMLERGHDVLFICYDNEAYMNTGIQRSGATPYGASTTTSPAGKKSIGKGEWKKDVPAIAEAHHIPYVATASIAFPADYQRKIKKALDYTGPKYIHVHAPCTTGWRYDTEKTVELAKLAVDTGMWALYEVDRGKFKMTYNPGKLKPVKDYLEPQGRFKHLKEEDIARIQEYVQAQYEKLLAREGC
jgi:pyruvate ferredoxin oxidoreductase beta subunit